MTGSNSHSWLKTCMLYFNCFFVTVATILGTGILGLPVKLAHSGFWPFLTTLTFCLFMQISIVYMFVDVLQRAEFRLGKDAESLQARQAPDLHRVGKMYLGPLLQRLFSASVIFHFMAILVTYTLAGGQAYSKLLGIRLDVIIIPYVLVYTSLVVWGGSTVQPVISILTVAKCILLLFMIGVVGVVGSEINMGPVDSWSAIAQPFLMSTVALGGVVNLMPVMYTTVPRDATSIWRYRASITAGCVACWVLNILWSKFILDIVPQTKEQSERTGIDVSLEAAEEAGEMATVPVIDVIRDYYPSYSWVAIMVQGFIVLSITVSYVALGTGLKHVLDGMVAHWAHARHQVLKGIAGVLGGSTSQAPHLPKSPSSINSTMALMGRGDGGGGGGFIQSTVDDDMGGDIGAGTGELADQTQSSGGMNEGAISTSRTPHEPALRDAAQLAELEDDNDIANGFADSDITDLTEDESSIASDIGRDSSRPDSGLRPGAQQSTGLGRRQSVQDVLVEGARALVHGAEAAAELEGVGGLSDDEDVEEARVLEPHANWGEKAGRQGTVGDLEEARAASTARPGSTPTRHELMTEVLSDRGVAGTCFGRTMRSRAYVYYALCFTGVTMVSLANPNGFVLMLELVESLAMNIESGLFIAIMYYGAVHDSKAKPSDLALPLSHGFSKALLYFSASTFSTAIIYDLYHSMDVVGGDEFAGLFFFMMVFVCLETLLLFTPIGQRRFREYAAASANMPPHQGAWGIMQHPRFRDGLLSFVSGALTALAGSLPAVNAEENRTAPAVLLFMATLTFTASFMVLSQWQHRRFSRWIGAAACVLLLCGGFSALFCTGLGAILVAPALVLRVGQIYLRGTVCDGSAGSVEAGPYLNQLDDVDLDR